MTLPSLVTISGLISTSWRRSSMNMRYRPMQDLGELVDLLLGQAHEEAELARLVGLQAGGRVHVDVLDLLRRVLGHLLDVHAAFGARP